MTLRPSGQPRRCFHWYSIKLGVDFSRSIDALRAAVSLFVYTWNACQLYKRAHPRYPAHIRDFVSVLVQTLPFNSVVWE
jgi:hypothetical protein